MSQGTSSIIGGTSGMLTGIGQSVSTGFDADLKEQDADIEQLRYARDQVSAFADSLKELINKTQSTMDAIQQGQNQTRTKILG